MPYSNAAQILETPTSTHDVYVQGRFCGPPGSGNGGYSVGLVAKHLGSEVEVTLKRPIPIDRTIQVVSDGDTATLVDADMEIASARHVELDLDIPEAITFAQAAAARADFPGYQAHPFPGCFVCGTNRCCGEGMCLFTGVVDEGIVASSWVPAAEFVTEEGVIGPELIGAALDCPGAWALIPHYGIEGPIVLGRMTYRLEKPIYAGERYVVMGWVRGREGRKAFCGTAIYDAEGQVCAAAAATWIQLT
ncbi:MAG: hypothetical protein JSU89_06650 [Myxococcales bacterium]|nr:MAG: hypothetical protein JSU89_06650 [Myxococcales bacterium]